MKKQLYMVVTMIALMVAALSSAKAQGPPIIQLRANIPFAFSVSDKTMPAGEYTIGCPNPGSNMKILQVRSRDGQESTLVRTNRVSGKIQDKAKLIFSRYGGQYFLAQVWLSSDSIGMQTLKSRTEKQVVRELAASKASKETVAVTAKR
jgi:hypothetical protein